MNQSAEDLFGVSERRTVGGSLRDFLRDEASSDFDDVAKLFLARQPVTRRGAVIRSGV